MAAKKKPAMPPQAKNLTPPSSTGVPSKVPANPATKGSAKGIEKKAAGMAKRTANKPNVYKATTPGTRGKLKKKVAGPSVGSGKKGMYW
jgi:hypothetical protein